MGWVSPACAAGVGRAVGAVLNPWRWFLVLLSVFGFVVFGVGFVGLAHAASIPLSLPAGVAANGASYVTSAGAAFSGAAFNSGLTTQVAGKAVTVPASWRMAANAGQIATSAMRLNPAWAIGGAVAAWALPYGAEWVASQSSWQFKETPNLGTNPNTNVSNSCNQQGEPSECGIVGTVGGAAFCGGAEWTIKENTGAGSTGPAGSGWVLRSNCIAKGNGTNYPLWQSSYYPRLWNRPSTGPAPVYQPMTNVRWDELATRYPLTDAAASQASQNGVGIPLEPVIAPQTVKVPISEPYVDPVSGRRFQDTAYITPSPTNPMSADLQTAKVEVDASGVPLTDPATGAPKTPEKSEDECQKFPNRLGCMEMGEVPKEADITKLDKNVTISPDSGWGADTAACPADVQTSFLKQPVSWSFKPVCDGADMFRPVVLAMAWISAIMIALGISRRT